MALDLTKLTLVGGKRGTSGNLWMYRTEDAAATVDTAGYFNAGVAYQGAYNLLEVGDVILRVTTSAGAFSTGGLHAVNSKASGVIDIADALGLTTTDTD